MALDPEPKDDGGTAANNDRSMAMWQKRKRASAAAQQGLFDSFQRWYDNFYAVFQEDIAPWRSKVMDPKLASKALAVLAKVALTDPEPHLLPDSRYDFMKARNNEELLQWQMRNPEFDNPLFFSRYSALCDAAVTGTGIALLPWTSKEKTIYRRKRDKDGLISMTEEEMIKKDIGYNDFVPWSIFRVFVEPGATSLHGARYVILQDFKTVEEIEEMSERIGPFDSAGMDVLDELEDNEDGNQTNITQIYEQSRNRLLKYLTGQTSTGIRQIELWTCYDRQENTFTYLANKGEIWLFEHKNYYWHGKFPGVPFYIKPRALSFWGDGLFERTERLASANDSIINHFLDQLDISLNGVMMRDINTDIVVQDMRPGGEIAYDGIKPEMVEVPQPDAQSFSLARQVFSEAIDENTITGYESGQSSDSTDKTAGTARGVVAIQSAGSDILAFFQKTYGESCKQWFSMWLSNNQQFLDYDVAVRVLGENGKSFPKMLTPEDIVTQGTLNVDVEEDALRPRTKLAKQQATVAYVQEMMNMATVAMQVQQPIKVNWYELSSMYGEAMEVQNHERIVEPELSSNDDPETENDLMLQGEKLTPHPAEDHLTHIRVHKDMLDDERVDEELRKNVLAHVAIHIAMYKQAMAAAQAQKDAQDQADHAQLDAAQAHVSNLVGQPMPQPGELPLPPQQNQPLMPPPNAAPLSPQPIAPPEPPVAPDQGPVPGALPQ
jgi:hypothetical protein